MARLSDKPGFEICILAGGLGTRMGRDKAEVRIAGLTLLARVRAVAASLPSAVRVRMIRKDKMPRCGPIGGILTALRSSKSSAVLFLACDMPFVSRALLRRLVKRSRGGSRAAVTVQRERAGFPLIIPVFRIQIVEQQRAHQEFSLQQLATALNALRLRVPARSLDLFNVNTPEDAVLAERLCKRNRAPGVPPGGLCEWSRRGSGRQS